MLFLCGFKAPPPNRRQSHNCLRHPSISQSSSRSWNRTLSTCRPLHPHLNVSSVLESNLKDTRESIWSLVHSLGIIWNHCVQVECSLMPLTVTDVRVA